MTAATPIEDPGLLRIEQPRLITAWRGCCAMALAEDLTPEDCWPPWSVARDRRSGKKPGRLADGDRQARGLAHWRRGPRCSTASTSDRREMVEENRPCRHGGRSDTDLGDELLRLIFFNRLSTRVVAEARRRPWRRDDLGRTNEEIARAFLLRKRRAPRASCARKRTLSESRADIGDTARRRSCPERSPRARGRLPHYQRRIHRGARTGLAAHPSRRKRFAGRVLTSIAPHEAEAHGLLRPDGTETPPHGGALPTRRVSPLIMGAKPRSSGPASRFAGGCVAWRAKKIGGAGVLWLQAEIMPATPRQGRRAIPNGRASPAFMWSWNDGVVANNRTLFFL